jgi:hypothetical protein
MTETELFENAECTQDEDGFKLRRYFDVDEDDEYTAIANFSIKIGDAHPYATTAYVSSITAKPVDESHCRVLVEYTPRTREASENAYGETWEFEIASQLVHINSVTAEALQTSYGQDVGTAIGVDGDSVNGVDVYRPLNTVRVTEHVTNGNISAKISTINSLIAKVNATTWKDWDASCVLYLGAQIRRNKEDDWLVTHSFQTGRLVAQDSITLADGTSTGALTIPAFSYMWFQHETQIVDGAPKHYIKSVHIATVYESGNLGALNLHDYDD